jgi:hypothetical protein
MSVTASNDPLPAFIRDHRVHFDVTQEITFRGSERLEVGYVIHLWALHPKGARALPGCAKCEELVARLREIALAVVPAGPRPTVPLVEPFEHALYDSKDVPGADEVMLSMRLAHREEYAASVDACEERCLKEIRTKLESLGVRER